jgi:hypothetical protein
MFALKHNSVSGRGSSEAGRGALPQPRPIAILSTNIDMVEDILQNMLLLTLKNGS